MYPCLINAIIMETEIALKVLLVIIWLSVLISADISTVAPIDSADRNKEQNYDDEA
jgi:hypothetical protein